MGRFFLILLTCVVTSFYFFPIVFTFLPAANTKMVLATCGVVVLGFRLARNRVAAILDKDFLILSVWAFAISMMSLFTMTYNGTRDGSFATYFMSMWVWLGGAYMVISIIRWVHGCVGVQLVANYLIAVCTFQCLLAIFFQYNPVIDNAVQSIIGGKEAFMGANTGDRLHGIGCALDVAGFKFATVLCMIGYFIAKLKGNYRALIFTIYMLCFVIITVIGNMISRSTIIGVGLVAVYWLYCLLFQPRKSPFVVSSFIAIAIFIPIIIALYNSSPIIEKNIRFGFEGFFSLVETGKWQTGSNDILKDMVVFPDNLKTWLIGDAYAANPSDQRGDWFDLYYTGPSFHGFYMQTDIGYCRYIFYFGIIGLLLFIGYFFKIYQILEDRFPQWRMIFLAILLVNFIGWTKVSSDLFVVFAPFLCITRKDEENAEDHISFVNLNLYNR